MQCRVAQGSSGVCTAPASPTPPLQPHSLSISSHSQHRFLRYPGFDIICGSRHTLPS